MRRANSEYVCMYVCLKHPSMHVCLKSLSVHACLTPVNMYVCLGCLSMYVCLQACLYACMFETLNHHPGVGPDSLRKMFSIWTTMQFFEICEGGYFWSPQTYIQTLHYYGYEPTINILEPSVERVSSMYVCMYVYLKHPNMLVCLKSLSVYVCLTPVNMHVCLGCLSMYVCLQACLYGCMFETPDVAILILLAGALTRSNYMKKLD